MNTGVFSSNEFSPYLVAALVMSYGEVIGIISQPECRLGELVSRHKVEELLDEPS